MLDLIVSLSLEKILETVKSKPAKLNTKSLARAVYSKHTSYCKWSTDNYQCDLCCYDGLSGGITIHVGTHRLKESPPALPSIENTDIDDFLDSFNRHNEFMMTAVRVPIGLAYDGQTFRVKNEQIFLEKLELLKSAGYIFPHSLIQFLEQKQQLAVCA